MTKIKRKKEEFYFLKEISQHNIVALTGKCNCRCVFCSHGNNPQKAKVYYGEEKPLPMILSALDFLDGNRDIIIGESASSLGEGEPFLYPHFFEVLKALRQRFPVTPISITTNGTKLTEENIKKLQEISGISLQISLNSLSYRKPLMGDATAVARDGIALLSSYHIAFSGSVVMIPEVTGWEDIKETVAYLHAWGGTMVRLLMPAYSRLAKEEYVYSWKERQETALKIIGEQEGITLLEPPDYRHNHPIIYGVVANSPGEMAQFCSGDFICSINGQEPKNRYDAWRLLRREESVTVQVRRGKDDITLKMEKPKGNAGGIVFENDLDCSRLEKMDKIMKGKSGNAIACTSKLGYDYVKENMKLYPSLNKVTLVVAESHFFGGNIAVAGLLTLSDFCRSLEGKNFDYVFLPQESFSDEGEDLEGGTLEDLDFEAYII